GVQRIEPDVRVVDRRGAAAHPGVGVAAPLGAVLAHPAAAAAAPTAARPVVARFVVQTRSDGVRVGLAVLPVVIPTSAAAAATAATAAFAGVLVVGGDGDAVALALVLVAVDQFVLILLGLVVESLVGQIRL